MNNDYQDAVELLTSQGKFYINLGLERIGKILELLGNPQDNLQCIHVAGTNGKGSVCAIIASVLAQSGRKTGLYTSPHIFEYTERIQIYAARTSCENSVYENTKEKYDISEETFSKYIFEIVELAGKNRIHLTEFEILTAVMFKYFSDEKVDTVVLETGLGGRFDATNIIKRNLCSVITHIDLDHTERLGNTRDKIAYEKAGIIKPGCPVVTSEGYEAIKDKADECGSLLVMTAPYENISELSLRGSFQQENLSLALGAVGLVFPDIPQDTIIKGLHNVQHPCRFQFFEDKMLLVDGAHNPNGAYALRKSLDMYFPDKKYRFVFGCLKTKDYPNMMKILFTRNDEIYFYHFNNPNSASFEELQTECRFPAKNFISLDDFEIQEDTITVICGSFYMLKEILNNRSRNRTI